MDIIEMMEHKVTRSIYELDTICMKRRCEMCETLYKEYEI